MKKRQRGLEEFEPLPSNAVVSGPVVVKIVTTTEDGPIMNIDDMIEEKYTFYSDKFKKSLEAAIEEGVSYIAESDITNNIAQAYVKLISGNPEDLDSMLILANSKDNLTVGSDTMETLYSK